MLCKATDKKSGNKTYKNIHKNKSNKNEQDLCEEKYIILWKHRRTPK